MNNFFSYLRLQFLATSGMFLLCIFFSMIADLADGTLSGKICWFHFTSLLLAGGVLLMEFTTKKSRFIFSLPDALLLLLFGIVLVSYDKDENLLPERFLFIAQLVALWFMLRGALQAHQELRPFFITIIIFTGIVPTIWGISHTINPAPITHPVFRLLETSLKPEPFYGYIAVIFPVCLNTLLRFKNCDKIALWKSRTFLFYFSILGSTLIITTLIFKTDHPVWLAALLSGIWVCWMRLIGWKQTKEAIQIHIQLQHFIPAAKNQCLCSMLPVKCGRKSRKLRFLICNFIGNIRRHNRMLTCLCTHGNTAFPVISHSVSRIFCRKCVIKRAALSFIPRRNKRCLSGAEQITQILTANTPAVIYVTHKGPMVCKTYDIAGIRCLQAKQIQIFIKYDTHVNPPVCFLL